MATKSNPRKRPADTLEAKPSPPKKMIPDGLFIREQNPLLRCIDINDPCSQAYFYGTCPSCGKLYKRINRCDCLDF